MNFPVKYRSMKQTGEKKKYIGNRWLQLLDGQTAAVFLPCLCYADRNEGLLMTVKHFKLDSTEY